MSSEPKYSTLLGFHYKVKNYSNYKKNRKIAKKMKRQFSIKPISSSTSFSSATTTTVGSESDKEGLKKICSK